MNGDNSIQAYVRGLVILGQAALEHHRRGEYLPADLTRQARELLALERTLAVSLPTDEPRTGRGSTAGALVADQQDEKSGEDERLVVEAADGLRQQGKIISVEHGQPLVVSVEETDGFRSDPIAEEHHGMQDPVVSSELHVPPAEPVSTKKPICRNCGATLRVGKRFCHRCGTPFVAVSESSDLASSVADRHDPA